MINIICVFLRFSHFRLQLFAFESLILLPSHQIEHPANSAKKAIFSTLNCEKFNTEVKSYGNLSRSLGNQHHLHIHKMLFSLPFLPWFPFVIQIRLNFWFITFFIRKFLFHLAAHEIRPVLVKLSVENWVKINSFLNGELQIAKVINFLIPSEANGRISCKIHIFFIFEFYVHRIKSPPTNININSNSHREKIPTKDLNMNRTHLEWKKKLKIVMVQFEILYHWINLLIECYAVVDDSTK